MTDDQDAALAAFNAMVEAEQQRRQDEVVQALADDYALPPVLVRSTLAACQWSVRRARKRLEGVCAPPA